MELILQIVGDWILGLLGKVVRHTKSTKTQLLVDILVAAALLALDGYAIWRAVNYYKQGNIPSAIASTAIVVISVLLLVFVVSRHVIRKRKEKGQTE